MSFRSSTHEEKLLGLVLASLRILLAVRNHLLRKPLGFFRFRPCGGDGLMLEKGGYLNAID